MPSRRSRKTSRESRPCSTVTKLIFRFWIALLEAKRLVPGRLESRFTSAKLRLSFIHEPEQQQVLNIMDKQIIDSPSLVSEGLSNIDTHGASNFETYNCSFSLYLESIALDLALPCKLYLQWKNLSRGILCQSTKQTYRQKQPTLFSEFMECCAQLVLDQVEQKYLMKQTLIQLVAEYEVGPPQTKVLGQLGINLAEIANGLSYVDLEEHEMSSVVHNLEILVKMKAKMFSKKARLLKPKFAVLSEEEGGCLIKIPTSEAGNNEHFMANSRASIFSLSPYQNFPNRNSLIPEIHHRTWNKNSVQLNKEALVDHPKMRESLVYQSLLVNGSQKSLKYRDEGGKNGIQSQFAGFQKEKIEQLERLMKQIEERRKQERELWEKLNAALQQIRNKEVQLSEVKGQVQLIKSNAFVQEKIKELEIKEIRLEYEWNIRKLNDEIRIISEKQSQIQITRQKIERKQRSQREQNQKLNQKILLLTKQNENLREIINEKRQRSRLRYDREQEQQNSQMESHQQADSTRVRIIVTKQLTQKLQRSSEEQYSLRGSEEEQMGLKVPKFQENENGSKISKPPDLNQCFQWNQSMGESTHKCRNNVQLAHDDNSKKYSEVRSGISFASKKQLTGNLNLNQHLKKENQKYKQQIEEAEKQLAHVNLMIKRGLEEQEQISTSLRIGTTFSSERMELEIGRLMEENQSLKKENERIRLDNEKFKLTYSNSRVLSSLPGSSEHKNLQGTLTNKEIIEEINSVGKKLETLEESIQESHDVQEAIDILRADREQFEQKYEAIQKELKTYMQLCSEKMISMEASANILQEEYLKLYNSMKNNCLCGIKKNMVQSHSQQNLKSCKAQQINETLYRPKSPSRSKSPERPDKSRDLKTLKSLKSLKSCMRRSHIQRIPENQNPDSIDIVQKISNYSLSKKRLTKKSSLTCAKNYETPKLRAKDSDQSNNQEAEIQQLNKTIEHQCNKISRLENQLEDLRKLLSSSAPEGSQALLKMNANLSERNTHLETAKTAKMNDCLRLEKKNSEVESLLSKAKQKIATLNIEKQELEQRVSQMLVALEQKQLLSKQLNQRVKNAEEEFSNRVETLHRKIETAEKEKQRVILHYYEIMRKNPEFDKSKFNFMKTLLNDKEGQIKELQEKSKKLIWMLTVKLSKESIRERQQALVSLLPDILIQNIMAEESTSHKIVTEQAKNNQSQLSSQDCQALMISMRSLQIKSEHAGKNCVNRLTERDNPRHQKVDQKFNFKTIEEGKNSGEFEALQLQHKTMQENYQIALYELKKQIKELQSKIRQHQKMQDQNEKKFKCYQQNEALWKRQLKQYQKILKKYTKVINYFKRENQTLQERINMSQTQTKIASNGNQIYNKIFISLVKLQKKLAVEQRKELDEALESLSGIIEGTT